MGFITKFYFIGWAVILVAVSVILRGQICFVPAFCNAVFGLDIVAIVVASVFYNILYAIKYLFSKKDKKETFFTGKKPLYS